MAQTLNEIASIINSNVRSGLKGVSNFSFSIPLLEREVVIERNRIIEGRHNRPGFQSAAFLQSINCIPVDKERLSKCPVSVSATDSPVFHISLPMINTNMIGTAVEYLGPSSRMSYGWKVYHDERFRSHKHLPVSCRDPYIYIDPTSNGDGELDGFIMNYTGNLKFLSFTGIIENPEDAEDYQCHGPLTSFPAPDEAVEEIIRRLTQKYIQHYRQFHAPTQPNTQTDEVS